MVMLICCVKLVIVIINASVMVSMGGKMYMADCLLTVSPGIIVGLAIGLHTEGYGTDSL